ERDESNLRWHRDFHNKVNYVFWITKKTHWTKLYSYLCDRGLYDFYSIAKYNIAGKNIRK
ncbi:MAG: hypothetical protein WAT37_03410, partial [Saprospiraceae bacterium]